MCDREQFRQAPVWSVTRCTKFLIRRRGLWRVTGGKFRLVKCPCDAWQTNQLKWYSIVCTKCIYNSNAGWSGRGKTEEIGRSAVRPGMETNTVGETWATIPENKVDLFVFVCPPSRDPARPESVRTRGYTHRGYTHGTAWVEDPNRIYDFQSTSHLACQGLSSVDFVCKMSTTPNIKIFQMSVITMSDEIALATGVGIYYSVFGSTWLPNHSYIAVYFPLVLLQWHSEYSTGIVRFLLIL